MSRYDVRQLIRNELIALNAIAAFIDTTNIHSNPGANDPWCSVDFYTDYDDPVCFDGTARQEFGNFDINVFTKAGKTDAVAVQAADAFVDHFKVWSSGSLEITGLLGPAEIQTADAEGKYYGVTVNFTYVYRY